MRAPTGCLFALVLLILISPAIEGREERRDPGSGRIRLKYIGDCLAVQTPTRGMELDPLISLSLVPSSIQEWAVDVNQIKRYMRLYMPRTLEHLMSTTDVIMLSNTAADYFRDEWIHWMADSAQGGLGLSMVGGYCSFGGYGYPDWGPTAVGAILPVETITGGKRDFAFRLSPVEEIDLLSIFDWERGPFFFAINQVKVRPGARPLATTDPEDRPLMAYQEVGAGSVLAFMTTWGLPWGDEFVRWEYFVDFSADMVYHCAGLEIPDPVIVHEIRILFDEFQLAEGLVRSILEFVGSLGGQVDRVQTSLDDLVLARGDAERLYIEQDYQGCLEAISGLVEEMSTLDEAAMKAKDAAFLWIYLTEWSAVTATVTISGYLLFVVMMRRKFYREVSSTRID